MKKNGFTLVELLAVIVILSILLGIAIPAVSNYITRSKRDSYMIVMEEYLKTIRHDITLDKYRLPIENNDVTIISLDMIELDRDRLESSFGNSWVLNKSYLAIINEGTSSDPEYGYFIASQDEGGYALPMLSEDDLNHERIIKDARNTMEVTIQALCGTDVGAEVMLPTIKGLEEVQAVNNDGNKLDWNAIIYSSENCGKQ